MDESELPCFEPEAQRRSTLPSGLVAVVESDRRRESRSACDVVIMPCGTMASGKFRKARLVDCSPNGVGILSTRRLPAGEQFLLKVRLKHVVLVVYTVRNCRPIDDGVYRIGAELTGFIGPHDCDAQAIFDALLAT